jgi:hypothetical protein
MKNAISKAIALSALLALMAAQIQIMSIAEGNFGPSPLPTPTVSIESPSAGQLVGKRFNLTFTVIHVESWSSEEIFIAKTKVFVDGNDPKTVYPIPVSREILPNFVDPGSFGSNGNTNGVKEKLVCLLSEMRNGTHSVTVQVETNSVEMMGYNVGSKTASSQRVTFLVDAIPPAMNITSPENKKYSSGNIPFTFSIDDSSSRGTYSIDGQNNVTAENATLANLSDGWHDIVLYATDPMGNVGKSSPVFFEIDTQPVLTPAATPSPSSSQLPTQSPIDPVELSSLTPQNSTSTESDFFPALQIALVLLIAVSCIIVLQYFKNKKSTQ